jgi:hypothetical protein
MSFATSVMTVCLGLTAPERAKFQRLQQAIFDLFGSFGHVVRLCQGTGDDDDRRIEFRRGHIGKPILSVSSIGFLSESDETTLLGLHRQLSRF